MTGAMPASTLAPMQSQGGDEISILYIHSACPYRKWKEFVQNRSVLAQIPDRELWERWSAASASYKRIMEDEVGAADCMTSCEAPVGVEAALAGLMSTQEFREAFGSVPARVEMVEIERLVAAQLMVNLTHVERLTNAGLPTSDQELVAFCLGTGSRDDSPLRVGRPVPGTFAYCSRHPGLSLLGVFECAAEGSGLSIPLGGYASRLVVAVIGFPLRAANAYRVGNRVILNNGFHRMYALRRAGFTMAPLLVVTPPLPELELPESICGIPSEYLCSAPRPALMRDFFNSQLTEIVRIRDAVRLVRVTASCTHDFFVDA